jgi:hypothetical protein
MCLVQCFRKVAVHLGYGTYIWLSLSKLPLKCAVVSLYSVVKQRLKCNPGKVSNYLIQFLLTMVLSIKARVFLVEYVFREGSRYTSLVQEQFVEKFPETPVPDRNPFRRLIENFRETCSVLDAERSGRPSKLNDKKLMDISDSALEDFTSSNFYKCTATFRTLSYRKCLRIKLNVFRPV